MSGFLEDMQGDLTKSFEEKRNAEQEDPCVLLEQSIERSEVGADHARANGLESAAEMWDENKAARQETYDAICVPSTKPMS